MKLRYILPLLCCLLSAVTGRVFATTCYFERSTKGDINVSVPDFWTSNDLIGPIGTNEVTQIMYPQSYWADVNALAGTGKIIQCDSGGSTYIDLTAPTNSEIIEPVYNMNGMGLLKTNVPGIVYSYHLTCGEGCVPGSDIDVTLPMPGATTRSNAFSKNYAGSETKWMLRLDLYQTPQYRPRPGQTQVHTVAGTIGSVMMSNKGKTAKLNVSGGSALFTLREPTCQRFGINGIDGFKEVDFGEFFLSDFDSTGFTARKNFTLNLYNCSLNGFRIYVNGPHTESGSILTNQKGSAEGVGVRLGSVISRNWQEIKVDGSESVGQSFTGNVDWYQERLDIPFTGELKKIGTIIKSGSFESTATFTIDYE
ncbi:type 1 fimbrial protein [Salmonella enterica]|nr:fimbrial protein [Salmonella enterica]ECC3254667.1 type 1 fimbrial protein [Salmonella enterica subsp. enterica]ECG5958844.1 type 1 fimbrial protein [Salmonella enterica subsp. enterica serovar Baguida]EDU8878083.1 type 1 fimbrial protein [Salmonella enterica subsp. enterica]EIZ8586852.1 type 1 fimbrial protein [Salmonella enterica subsp. enterica]EJH7009124.1 type 1 fimbrial protein [Salmonella enterica]